MQIVWIYMQNDARGHFWQRVISRSMIGAIKVMMSSRFTQASWSIRTEQYVLSFSSSNKSLYGSLLVSNSSPSVRNYLPTFLAFEVHVVRPANYILCFRRLSLLSCGYSRVAWIALSFKLFSCWEILSLSCESCVAAHFLFRVLGGYPAFSRCSYELIWIFVLIDLFLTSLCDTFFLLSILSRDILATWSVSDLAFRWFWQNCIKWTNYTSFKIALKK
jgi:hypothetical protein